MKFPKSMHADGWDSHISADAPRVKTNSPAFNLRRGFKAGAKPVSLHTPLHGDVPAWTPAAPSASATPSAAPARPVSLNKPVNTPSPAFAAAAPAAASMRPAGSAQAPAPAPRSSSVPWVVGAGVGVLLIGGAVAVSRNLAPSTPAESTTPVVVGQVTPSPEDAQLQNQPPAAGPTAMPADTAPVVDEPSTRLEAPKTDAAPADAAPVKPEAAPQKAPAMPPVNSPATADARIAKAPAISGPPVWTATPAPRAEAPVPVVRTLTPQPQVLAQASPPPLVRETPQAVAPVTAPMTTPSTTPATTPQALPAEAASATAPAVPPVTAAPLAPPVIAQAAPASSPSPATPDPADTQITVQVRQALAADATLSAVPIAVSTDHGVVKLEGQAPDVQARERATVVASNTVGVKAVDNRLTLPPVASVDRLPAASGG